MRGVPLADGRAFLREKPAARPNCAVVNVDLPELGGVALQTELIKIKCNIPMIMVSDRAGDVASAVSAFKNGALDYLEKPIETANLLERLRFCLERDREILKSQKKYAAVMAKYETLTERERQVAECSVHGLHNRETAEELDISVKTVEVHRASAMKKMGAKSLVQLADDLKTIEFDPFTRESRRYLF